MTATIEAGDAAPDFTMPGDNGPLALADFAGRKVRFIGDCVHGLTVEGTAQTTDEKDTISNLTLLIINIQLQSHKNFKLREAYP